MAIAVHLVRQTPMVILFMSDRCAVLEGLLQKLMWPVSWPQGTGPAAAPRTKRATRVEQEWTRTPIESGVQAAGTLHECAAAKPVLPRVYETAPLLALRGRGFLPRVIPEAMAINTTR